MRSKEFINEDDNIVKGDFSLKGGPKPQIQNAKKTSIAQAFGSEGYNILIDNGIKLIEKPSYWSDLERKPIGEVTLQKIKKLFQQHGLDLPSFEAWEIYAIDPDNPNSVVPGPLSSIENMPLKGVFIIRDLPYKDDEGNIKIGNFIVDSQGANRYIRFWRKI